MKRPNVRIDSTEFVTIWQKANSMQEVLNAFKIYSIRTIVSKAARLRKKGVPLKKFHPGPGQRIDYESLARLAKKLARE